MLKNGIFDNLISTYLEVSIFPKKENYNNDENERVSKTSFHSLEYSLKDEYNTLNGPISTSFVRFY